MAERKRKAPAKEPEELAPVLGYAEALAELETILRELEAEAVDVDRLAEQVRRATVLIDLCRTRVESARMEVTQVMAALDGTVGDVGGGGGVEEGGTDPADDGELAIALEDLDDLNDEDED